MKYLLKILVLSIVIFYSCNNNDESNIKTKDINIERVYSLRFSSNEFDGTKTVTYRHYLFVTNYSDKLFEQSNFVKIVKKYIDTCSINRDSINSIYFLKSNKDNGFESNELDEEKINTNTFLGFILNKKEIEAIRIFNGGFHKTFKNKNGSIIEY